MAGYCVVSFAARDCYVRVEPRRTALMNPDYMAALNTARVVDLVDDAAVPISAARLRVLEPHLKRATKVIAQ